jgi:hypothetical protein
VAPRLCCAEWGSGAQAELLKRRVASARALRDAVMVQVLMVLRVAHRKVSGTSLISSSWAEIVTVEASSPGCGGRGQRLDRLADGAGQ